MKSAIVFVLLLLGSMSADCQTLETKDEFKKYFDEAGVQGSFALYDLKRDRYVLVNPTQFERPFIPASTFKICNSLIGLETGVIPDEHFVLKWDGVKRQVASWNADQDLQAAYKNSAVWYYQELARRVGGKRMKSWLDKAKYGNADTSGGIDLFWLTGGLRVTPKEQLDFLKRLYQGQLPFSKRSIRIVEKIMIEEQAPDYTLRTKTGWGEQGEENIGWYIGYLTTKDDIYFFATCIQKSRPDDNFPKHRKTIAKKILSELGVLPGPKIQPNSR